MKILELAQDYENITIFRHQLSDHDAMGSQFALKLYLKTAFPQKHIYALGHSVGACAKFYPSVDDAEDEIVANSIAFVLDSSTRERIDDQRYATAQKIIKIDHHIPVDDYADESLVLPQAAATCEILTFLFEEEGQALSKEIATYLYYGISADSLSFTTNNTSEKTLLAASKLLPYGVDVTATNMVMTGMDENKFRYNALVRSHCQRKGNVAYSIMRRSEYEAYGMDYRQAKENVTALGGVEEFEIWCLFTESEEKENYFHGSLRSRSKALNEVASRYRGGGHKNACGVKFLTLSEIDAIVHELNLI